MAKYEMLDNITHANLRVVAARSEKYGDKIGIVRTVPTEFADVQREFPILFRKDNDSEGYYCVALMGFEKDENLFLDESGWTASYVPAMMAKDAFVVGFQEQVLGGDVQSEPVIHVDMENPRISNSEGEPVFLKHGGNSPYIEKIGAILKGIQQGMQIGQLMYKAYEEAKLITPIKLEITLNKDMQRTLSGFYTIDEERLRSLDAETLHKLNVSGFLQGAYLMIASLSNIKKLIDIKNRRIISEQNTANTGNG